MKNFYLIIGFIFLVDCSSAQYSYVYQIRHENRGEGYPKADFRDLNTYKSEEGSRSEIASREGPKTRDFNVKSPEMGPNLLNVIKQNEKPLEPIAAIWQSEVDGKHLRSPLVLQSDTNAPIYTRQPSPKSYSSANDIPLYGEKLMFEVPKNYPILNSPQILEQRKREQKPVYSLSYPSPPPVPTPHPQRSYLKSAESDQKMRTVHSIQTPNYKIQLVSQPEPIEHILPLLKQYQLSTQPFQSQSYSQSQSQSYIPPQKYPTPAPIPSYPSTPSHSVPDSGKALMVSIEPDSRVNSEQIRHDPRGDPYVRSVPSYAPTYEERRPEPIREKLLVRDYRPEPTPLPRPILDLPRQELPPQIEKLKSRPIAKMPSPEIRTHPLLERQYPNRKELVRLPPVTALYQTGSPNLSKNGQSYSRVEYAEEDGKRDVRPVQAYAEEPVIYRIVEREEPLKSLPIDLTEQLDKLRENPSAQKIFFEKIKTGAVEIPERGRTKYLKVDDQPLIASDPNYKSSPLPEEYKPYTQTRYYKTYV